MNTKGKKCPKRPGAYKQKKVSCRSINNPVLLMSWLDELVQVYRLQWHSLSSQLNVPFTRSSQLHECMQYQTCLKTQALIKLAC